MINCCNGITDLGCYNFCDRRFDTGIVESKPPTTYTFEIVGTGETFTGLSATGLTIKFNIPSTTSFNEDSTVLFTITSAAGVPLTSGGNNCFSIFIKPGIDKT